MKRMFVLLFMIVVFCSCSMSFEPFPSMTKKETAAALKLRDDNIISVAQAISSLTNRVEKLEDKARK